MNFQEEIETFQKSKLKPCTTFVRQADGQTYLEAQEKGKFCQNLMSSSGHGFVLDMQPDFNVGMVMPGLKIGSQDVASNLDILQENNISHIINLCPNVPNYFEDQFTYLNKPLLDIPEFNILSQLDGIIGFIRAAHQVGGCVLVHCNAGCSRAPTVAIAYLLHQGISIEEAWKRIKDCHPNANPNASFMHQLLKYKQENVNN